MHEKVNAYIYHIVCDQIKIRISLVDVDIYHRVSLASIILSIHVLRAPKGIFGNPREVYIMIMFTHCFHFLRMFPSIQIHKDIVGKVNHCFLPLGRCLGIQRGKQDGMSYNFFIVSCVYCCNVFCFNKIVKNKLRLEESKKKNFKTQHSSHDYILVHNCEIRLALSLKSYYV